MINKFFDIVVCLTQKKRLDRQVMFDEECEKWNIKSELFYAIEHESPQYSFCQSQIAMLKWFLETGKETLLTLEDDVAFIQLENFKQVTQELPKDWQMFYLGANAKPYPEFDQAVYYSEHLRVIKSAFCTHAVGYKRELVQEIVDTYEYKGGQLFDTWLDIHILKKRPVYIACPMLAIQKGVKSDLWNRNVDYGDIFQASNEYLKSIK